MLENTSRISGTARQRQNRSPNEKVYDDGFWRVEYANFYAACQNHPIKLTRLEFLIVSLLTRNTGRSVAPLSIWTHLWNEDKAFKNETLRVYICHLRSKLANFGILIKKNTDGYKLVFPDK